MIVAIVFCIRAGAQVELYGVDLKSNGNFSFGYSSDFNDTSSDHGLYLGADANVNGFYYSPNFLSFSVQPYYQRSQANSDFQSLTNSSGLNSTVNIFSGSHFPGTVSYSYAKDSTGQFGIPGSQQGLLTNGNGSGFGIGWGVMLPGLPKLNFNFNDNSNENTIYGSDAKAKNDQKNFSVQEFYAWDGWQTGAGYSHFNSDATFPSFLEGVENPHTTTSSNQYQFSANHPLPKNGTFSASFNRNSYDSTYSDDRPTVNSNGTVDNFNTVFTMRPTNRLSLAADGNYTDNAMDQFTEQVISAGGAVPTYSLGTVRAFRVNTSAGYILTKNLFVSGDVAHQEQFFMGDEFKLTTYGGNVAYNYARPLFGALNFSFGAYDGATQDGHTGLGLTANVNFNRKIHQWDVDAYFDYAQNVQTLLIFYTASSMTYGGHVMKKFGDRTFWNTTYAAGQTAFSTDNNGGSRTDSLSTSVMYKRIQANAFWSQSNGESILTPSGLLSVPGNLPPGVISPNEIVFFNSKAYGFGLSSLLFRRLTINGGYSKANGGTNSVSSLYSSDTEIWRAQMRYRFRKLYLDAGYTRFYQNVGSSSTLPSAVSSYFVGVSRWFNFF
ncbi:hypothetical protein [Candidatus Korobacter versatilis]|uniref:hypothetical protein n=1 Tax=Candidatus Korobacter versatilis TaxID=658062 RepID=UPI0003007AAC|nr:hypothetical protein [Candidatus Koribacter versatilis]